MTVWIAAISVTFAGLVAAFRLAGRDRITALVGYSLLFVVSVGPWLAVAEAFIGASRVTVGSLALSSWILTAIVLLFRRKSAQFVPRPSVDRWEWIALGVAVVVAITARLHYSDSEFLLSLASYLQKGEAECFYMLTFRLVDAIQPDYPAGLWSALYDIISTPGNAVFTSGTMPILGAQTFATLYVVFRVVIFLMTFALARAWTGRAWAALAVAAFAVWNPYLLFVEVLDRNVLAFALGLTLLHDLWTHEDHPLFHGFLYGLTAGTGLRFLGLFYAGPIVVRYAMRRRPVRAWVYVFASALAVFAFNLPHLYWHGFHALGEKAGLWRLTWATLTTGLRTPLLPYPTGLYYAAFAVSCLGTLAAALAVTGVVGMARRFREGLLATLFVAAPIFGVLAVQRDWIESDKLRILIATFPALVLWLAWGLAEFAEPARRRRLAAFVAGALVLLTLLTVEMLPYLATRADGGSDERKPTYQHETPEYSAFYRRAFTRAYPWPDYGRLFQKLEWRRKRIEDRLIARALFAQSPVPAISSNRWVAEHLDPRPHVPSSEANRPPFEILRLNLDKLVTDPDHAVVAMDADDFDASGRVLWVDFSKPADVLDVYHKQVRVSWQSESLPVTLLTGKPEYDTLGELPIELNAFTGYGEDEVGFVKVNLVSLRFRGLDQEAAATGFSALPQRDKRPELFLRVPTRTRIILRNWVVNTQKDNPFRIDAWEIRRDDDTWRARFYPLEPESYL